MKLSDITFYILTFNEELNLNACLSSISWAKKIVVLDSFSSDKTAEIASLYKNVEFISNKFISHADQHSYALNYCRDASWVMRLDADWIVTEGVKGWLENFEPDNDVMAIYFPFQFFIHGELAPIAFYPPVACLFRKDFSNYVQDGHTERLIFDGRYKFAPVALKHDDRKTIDRFFQSQINYSQLELEKKLITQVELGHFRKHTFKRHFVQAVRGNPTWAPIIIYFFLGFLKFGFFKSLTNKHYMLQRLVAESMRALRNVDYELSSKSKND